MADPAIAREWLAKADEDFLFAEANLREGSEFWRNSGNSGDTILNSKCGQSAAFAVSNYNTFG